jgi:16S rRNA G966 N2-methylase RsmD
LSEIEISKIKYGNRFRRDYGNIDELAESIKTTKGLLCPIGVTKDGLLIHGARRLKAYPQAFPAAKTIPSCILDIPVKENGEIDENLVRKDFTVEELLAIKKYRESLEPNLRGMRTDLGQLKGKIPTGSTMKRRDERIAKDTGYSYKSLHKLEQIAEACKSHPESLGNLPDKIDKGMKINKAWKLVQNHKKREELKAEPKLSLPQDCKLILGDCRFEDKQIPDCSVAMVFTDPMYNQEALPLFGWLGRFALRVLKPGGSLMTIAPHYALPEIFDLMRDPMTGGLKYVHAHAIFHKGGAAIQKNAQVFIGWKPILEFVKGDGKLRTHDFIMRDCVVVSHPPDKALHECEQSPIEASHFIAIRTVEGDTIVDPFLGSGSFGVAALQLKRKFIGIEKERDFFNIAEDRIRTISKSA